MTENPYSHDLIEYLVWSGAATQLWPHDPEREDGTRADSIIETIASEMGWGEEHVNFLNSLSAGHTSADSARDAGRTPTWGRARLRELREHFGSLTLASNDPSDSM